MICAEGEELEGPPTAGSSTGKVASLKPLTGGAGIGIAIGLMVLIIRGSARADTTGLMGVVSFALNI